MQRATGTDMRHFLSSLTLFLILWTTGTYICFIEFREKSPPSNSFRSLQIVSCHDADTCLAKSPQGLCFQLRLAGIDAPELGGQNDAGQIFGRESTEAVNALLKGQWVHATLESGDPYGRHLAWLWDISTQKLWNETFIKRGLAFAYQKPCTWKSTWKWADDAEKEAKRTRRGLWSLRKKPLRPWIFRRKNKHC